MRGFIQLSVLVSFLAMIPYVTAADQPLTSEQKSAVEKIADEAAEKAANASAEKAVKKNVEAQAERQFAGLNFGVGLSLTIDTGGNDRVKDAEIVDGIVRVSTENNATARIMLESHYFFNPNTFLGLTPTNQRGKKDFGCGPFIALQPGTDEIIEAIGLGIMFGWKRETLETSTGSWNLGIGLVVDPNVKILGDGFEENQPPPGNETTVRFKETDQWGALILVSFTW